MPDADFELRSLRYAERRGDKDAAMHETEAWRRVPSACAGLIVGRRRLEALFGDHGP